MALPQLVDARRQSYKPGSPDPLADAGGDAPRTWSWTSPAGDGECRHGLSERAWCVICTPPATGRRGR